MTSSSTQFVLAHPADDADTIRKALASMPPLTSAPIPLATLAQYLRKTGLILVLKGVVDSPDAPKGIRDGLTLFLDQLADTRATNLDTTDPDIASLAGQVLGGLVSLKYLDGAGLASIYALGGGLLYDVPTVEDIKALRESLSRSADLGAIESRVTSAYSAFLNERINPARSDAALPIPTWDEFLGGLK